MVLFRDLKYVRGTVSFILGVGKEKYRWVLRKSFEIDITSNIIVIWDFSLRKIGVGDLTVFYIILQFRWCTKVCDLWKDFMIQNENKLNMYSNLLGVFHQSFRLKIKSCKFFIFGGEVSTVFLLVRIWYYEKNFL